MTSILQDLSRDDQFVLLLVTVVLATSALIPISIVGLVQWRKVREREAATGLVHDMLARGFSPDEIDQVLTGTRLDSIAIDSIVAKSKAAVACQA
ncbi:MAG: hypothetical protein KDA93_16720 [Planctomycetaceae bacterium]|nr:hypothetical protein [Planctomycetaceae bacterium]